MIFLDYLKTHDSEALYQYKNRNREAFKPFQPMLPESYYSLERQSRVIEEFTSERLTDISYTFGIFYEYRDNLIGLVSLSQVMRGPYDSAILGYSIDQSYHGKGLMSHAVILIRDKAFNDLGLHRIQAAAMPANTPSIRVLEKNHFNKIGIAKSHLKINGKWEDHILYERVDE